MKGLVDMGEVIATLIFIGAVIATVLILRSDFISHTGGVETPIENLEALQAAYAAESCFLSLSGGDYITADFLAANSRDFIGDENFCNIAYPPIHAEITDVDTGEEWVFDRPALADLERIFDSTRKWMVDKLVFWKSAREKSKPEHTIFVPILYEKVKKAGDEDIIFRNGRKYILTCHKSGNDLILDVHPIERYGALPAFAPERWIEGDGNLVSLRSEMDSISDGTQKSFTVIVDYRDIKAGELTGDYELVADHDECGKGGRKKICMSHWGTEIHSGRLYVKV